MTGNSLQGNVSKQDRLDQLKAEIITQNVCPDLAKTATQLVFGEGNPRAELVFIGEAPGRQEDESGRPFVGASGKLLSGMIESIGLSRADVYITNIVKYRPPNNRDPRPAEIAAFRPYLEAQLAAIAPKLVVTLGRHSLHCFRPDLQISQVHGQPVQHKRQAFLPLYHPAAALYNGGLRKTLADDFLRIPHILKNL